MSRLSDYIRLVARWWWLALLPLLVMALATVLSYRPAPTAYQVTTRYAAGAMPENTPGQYNYDRYYTWVTSDFVARAFSSAVRTGAFASAIAARLSAAGANVQADQVLGSLAAEYKNSVLVVYVTWPDADLAKRIAEEATIELTQHADDYWLQTAGLRAPPFTPLDPPTPAAISVSLRDRFDLPARVLLAVAAGVLLAFVAHWIDPFVRERRDIENAGLTVIGEIPRE